MTPAFEARNGRVRKTAFWLGIFILFPLLGGCWSRIEVNDIAIVTAAGLDQGERGNVRLSLMLAVPRLIGTGSAQGGGESKIENDAAWVVTEEGSDLMDTYRKLQEKLPRQIFFSHCRVIVLGSSLASRSVTPYLDFFERYRESQLKSYLVVSKTSAEDVLAFKSKFEKLPSEVLREELKRELIPSVRLVDFLNALMSEGDAPFAPVVEIKKSAAGSGGVDSLAVTGVAVFRGDRMVGRLNDEEGRGVMWVRKMVHEGVVTVEFPHEGEPEKSAGKWRTSGFAGKFPSAETGCTSISGSRSN
ncbi:Ger(x)C family spore germination protein [Cohnella caldifontis]|uniref:Ger(x)C family spore germination protein n=1 Tax=Cohnella caldifontis TaxID=3027471 RepID=UPI0023ECB8C3|nr:Ger(x)C family spore germination protein [Cohnella sp. YIM B05605]